MALPSPRPFQTRHTIGHIPAGSVTVSPRGERLGGLGQPVPRRASLGNAKPNDVPSHRGVRSGVPGHCVRTRSSLGNGQRNERSALGASCQRCAEPNRAVLGGPASPPVLHRGVQRKTSVPLASPVSQSRAPVAGHDSRAASLMQCGPAAASQGPSRSPAMQCRQLVRSPALLTGTTSAAIQGGRPQLSPPQVCPPLLPQVSPRSTRRSPCLRPREHVSTCVTRRPRSGSRSPVASPRTPGVPCINLCSPSVSQRSLHSAGMSQAPDAAIVRAVRKQTVLDDINVIIEQQDKLPMLDDVAISVSESRGKGLVEQDGAVQTTEDVREDDKSLANPKEEPDEARKEFASLNRVNVLSLEKADSAIVDWNKRVADLLGHVQGSKSTLPPAEIGKALDQTPMGSEENVPKKKSLPLAVCAGEPLLITCVSEETPYDGDLSPLEDPQIATRMFEMNTTLEDIKASIAGSANRFQVESDETVDLDDRLSRRAADMVCLQDELDFCCAGKELAEEGSLSGDATTFGESDETSFSGSSDGKEDDMSQEDLMTASVLERSACAINGSVFPRLLGGQAGEVAERGNSATKMDNSRGVFAINPAQSDLCEWIQNTTVAIDLLMHKLDLLKVEAGATEPSIWQPDSVRRSQTPFFGICK